MGEVALVPHNSPISNLNRIFYNTGIDENASCHLAVGSAYPFNMKGGTAMSNEELLKHECNVSLTHVDFMIGSAGWISTGSYKTARWSRYSAKELGILT